MREAPEECSVVAVIGVGLSLHSMEPNSMFCTREFTSSSVKYLSVSIMTWSISFTSYWRAPSRMSCMISGKRDPLHT